MSKGKKKKSKSSSGKKQSASKKQDTPPSLPPPESFEGMFAGILGGGKLRDVDEAQDIMYDAWEAPNRKQRIALAKKALETSPDCADAYVLLAEETAASLEEAIDLYRKGVEAGERALGKKAFKEDVGYFWGLLETRPYMRACAGLAGCLWEARRREEAVEHYQEMLRLNPKDNQGIRDLLMPCLIELNRDRDAEKLFMQYEDDCMATWLYSRALLDFRKQGDSPGARKSLEAALEENKHVPAYLLGRKRMPRTLPSYYGFGDENEAIFYVEGNKAAWETTPGAMEWIASKLR